MTSKRAFALILSLLLLLGFASCGKTAEEHKDDTVQVSTVDEFIDAVGSSRCIVLSPGTYNLTNASSYGKETGNKHCFWRHLWDSYYELVIEGVENLTIEGSNSSIVTVPRSAAVLNLSDCSLVNIQDTTFGHTVASEACEGGVVKLSLCKDISLFSCSFYGCGTTGVTSQGTENLYIRDCDIYSCSYSAIEYSLGRGLKVINCDIHNLGSDAYDRAYSIFILNSCSDIDIQSCRIHDCISQMFIYGYDVRNALMANLNVYSNRFSSVFGNEADIAFTGLSFSSNSFDRWFAESSSGKVSIDGTEYNEEKMTAEYSDQLSSYGVGTVETEMRSHYLGDCKEVHVSTADEFLDAIASDTVICLDENTIDLSESSSYKKLKDTVPGYENPSSLLFTDRNYAWLERYDGYALVIGCVRNFHIIGPGRIVTKITYADVLSFYDSEEVSLFNVTLGHDAEPGSCVGGVINLSLCQDAIIDSCDLYGCGILGISAANCNDVNVQKTLIHDCSYGGVVFSECQNVAFIESDVQNCPFPNYDIQSCINFSIDGKVMASSCSF